MAGDWVGYLHNLGRSPVDSPIYPGGPTEAEWRQQMGLATQGAWDMFSGTWGPPQVAYLRPLAEGIPTFGKLLTEVPQSLSKLGKQVVEATEAAYNRLPDLAKRTIHSIQLAPDHEGALGRYWLVDGGQIPSGRLRVDPEAFTGSQGWRELLASYGKQDLSGAVDWWKLLTPDQRMAFYRAQDYGTTLVHEAGHGVDRALRQMYDRIGKNPDITALEDWAMNYQGPTPYTGLFMGLPEPGSLIASEVVPSIYKPLFTGGALRDYSVQPMENFADAFAQVYTGPPSYRLPPLISADHLTAVLRAMNEADRLSRQFPQGLP